MKRIAGNQKDYADVIGLALSADETALYSVHAERRVLVRHNLGDGGATLREIEGTPSGLAALPRKGSFVVSVREKSPDAVLVFDSQADALYFIPAGGAL